MKKVSLSEIQEDFPRYLRQSEGEDVVILEGDEPVGMLLGFASEDEWFDGLPDNPPVSIEAKPTRLPAAE